MLGGLAWAHRNGHTAARATLFRAQLRLYCVLRLLRFAIWFVGDVNGKAIHSDDNCDSWHVGLLAWHRLLCQDGLWRTDVWPFRSN